MAGLVELHSMPEIPSIAHFCSLFKVALDLPEVEIDQLEASLLKQSNDDIFTGSLVDRLLVKLLIGCLPMYATKIHDGNYTVYLKQLIQSKQEEAEEEGYPFDFENPFETSDVEDFEDLTVVDRVRVIHQLTELRLQCDDIYEKFKDLDPEGLRVEPLGVDSNNVTYWYFYGTRLYREIKPSKKKRPKKGKAKEDSDSETVDEAGDGAEGAAGWSLVCSAESQWVELTNKLKKSKKKQDKELHETLAENFLPEISKMFSELEREEKIKLMLANKRTSTRLVRVREQKEQQHVRAAEEEAAREMERVQEEARRKQLEKENNLKSREERARLREQKQLYERVIKEHDYYLQTNRKRSRARGGSPDQDQDNQSEGETESEEQGELKARRRNPALREFHRLLSSEEPADTHGGRNLRL